MFMVSFSDIKSTGARNDYMLSLVTANAHQGNNFSATNLIPENKLLFYS